MVHSFQPWPFAQKLIDKLNPKMSIFPEEQSDTDEDEPSEKQIYDFILWSKRLNTEIPCNHLR
jgi:hypothetical protein